MSTLISSRNEQISDKYLPAPSTSIPPPLLVAILSGKPRRRSGQFIKRTLGGNIASSGCFERSATSQLLSYILHDVYRNKDSLHQDEFCSA